MAHSMSWEMLSLANKFGNMGNGLRPLKERHVLVNVTITCKYMYCSAHTHFAFGYFHWQPCYQLTDICKVEQHCT
jgi:hypothetical protein